MTALKSPSALKPTGIAVPVSIMGQGQDKYLASARRVENRVPQGATWDGNKALLVTAEEFDAMRTGTILPAKDTKPTAKKSVKKSL